MPQGFEHQPLTQESLERITQHSYEAMNSIAQEMSQHGIEPTFRRVRSSRNFESLNPTIITLADMLIAKPDAASAAVEVGLTLGAECGNRICISRVDMEEGESYFYALNSRLQQLTEDSMGSALFIKHELRVIGEPFIEKVSFALHPEVFTISQQKVLNQLFHASFGYAATQGVDLFARAERRRTQH